MFCCLRKRLESELQCELLTLKFVTLSIKSFSADAFTGLVEYSKGMPILVMENQKQDTCVLAALPHAEHNVVRDMLLFLFNFYQKVKEVLPRVCTPRYAIVSV